MKSKVGCIYKGNGGYIGIHANLICESLIIPSQVGDEINHDSAVTDAIPSPEAFLEYLDAAKKVDVDTVADIVAADVKKEDKVGGFFVF